MARHKEFDRNEVLEKAMETFWRYGYEGTSVQDLVENMGLNRGSIYDTFGDKRSLFLEAIAQYEEKIVQRAIARLEADGASKPAIIEHFHTLIDRAVSDETRRGCLITNTAVELCPHDSDMVQRIAANIERIEQAFYKALLTAKGKGEIPGNRDLHAIARYLTCCMQGLRVVSKVSCDREKLQAIADVALSVID